MTIKVYDVKRKKLADSVSMIGSMLLFLIFLTFSLILVSCAANAYSKISGNFDETFSSSAAVQYVSNRLRSGDGAQIYRDGRAIVIDCGELTCVIYSNTDGIYELYMDKDEELRLSGGEMIFADTELSVIYDDGLYLITAKTGRDRFSAYCKS